MSFIPQEMRHIAWRATAPLAQAGGAFVFSLDGSDSCDQVREPIISPINRAT